MEHTSFYKLWGFCFLMEVRKYSSPIEVLAEFDRLAIGEVRRRLRSEVSEAKRILKRYKITVEIYQDGLPLREMVSRGEPSKEDASRFEYVRLKIQRVVGDASLPLPIREAMKTNIREMCFNPRINFGNIGNTVSPTNVKYFVSGTHHFN